MRTYNHLSFADTASAGDRYLRGGSVASQYAVQMMTPGRIIGFRCYSDSGSIVEQAIVRNVAPVYFASGDRIAVYIRYDLMFGDTYVETRKNGAVAGSFYTKFTFSDYRANNWAATVLVEYT